MDTNLQNFNVVGDNVRRYRVEQDLSQKELSERRKHMLFISAEDQFQELSVMKGLLWILN